MMTLCFHGALLCSAAAAAAQQRRAGASPTCPARGHPWPTAEAALHINAITDRGTTVTVCRAQEAAAAARHAGGAARVAVDARSTVAACCPESAQLRPAVCRLPRARPRTSDPTALAIRPCFAPASAPMTLTPTASPAPTCCATPPPGPCSRLPAPPAPSRLRQPHLHRPRPRLDVRRRPSRPPALSEVETLDSVSRHRARSTAPRPSRPAPARSALQRPAGLVPFDHAQRPQRHPAPLQHWRPAWLCSAAQHLAWLCSTLVRLA